MGNTERKELKFGNLLIRVGFGLLFVWGGLEKFFEGFLGGVGLEKMALGLYKTGWSFLGDTGTLVLAFVLALVELLAGVSLIINRKLVLSFATLASIMMVALLTVYLPQGNWMKGMIHLALITSLTGMAFNYYEKGKSLLQQV